MTSAFAVAIPWRARTRRGQVEWHPLRRNLLDWIRKRPGIQLKELCRSAGVHRSTAQYHLHVLNRAGLVRSFHSGRARVFASEMVDAELVERLAVIRQPPFHRLVRLLLQSPGIIQRDMSASLALSRKTFRAHAGLLRRIGLLTETRDGRTKQYHATPALEGLVQDHLKVGDKSERKETRLGGAGHPPPPSG